jgi:membrane-associated phospholipid phosphatase
MFAIGRTPAFGVALVSLCAGVGVPVCAAQATAITMDTVPVAQPHAVSWSEGLVLLGGTSVLLASDPLVSEETSEHPTVQASDAASVFRVAGDSRFYVGATLATLGTGLATGNDAISRTGRQLAVSGALAAASFGLMKSIMGRSRPDADEGAYDFHPFHGAGSFPSGHSAMAFAMATTLGDASGNPLIRGGLYLFAAGTAWSRVYNQRHWPSDVFFGAALGITSAKLVNGRWKVFGIRSPEFLVGPHEAGLRLEF